MSGSPDIRDYVAVLFIRDDLKKLSPPEGYVRQSVLIGLIKDLISIRLATYRADQLVDCDKVAEYIFELLLGNQIISFTSDHFAGDYYKLQMGNVANFRGSYLGGNAIAALAREIGPTFFNDVFGALTGHLSDETTQAISAQVPDKDIIVNLNDDQIRNFDVTLDELVDSIEKNNGIPDEPGLKERLLGQVKAGRELIRAGSFRAYLLHVTLISALSELIERYKETAIAMIAASLVDLLVKNALGFS